MVLHSGNHEIISIRHRDTQTLYISHVIEPYSCSDPAYGKFQVGVYIAAIQETMDRARQDIESREKISRDPPAEISLKNKGAKFDGDLEDNSLEGPIRPNNQSKGSGRSGGKGKRPGKQNAKRHANGKEVDGTVCILLCGAVVVHDSFTGTSGQCNQTKPHLPLLAVTKSNG